MVDKYSQVTKKMSSRERFRKTMRYDIPDRVPYFEEGIRKSVLKVWQRQGLPKDTDLFQMFPYDKRESIEPDLEPRPKLTSKFRNMSNLKKKNIRLNNPKLSIFLLIEIGFFNNLNNKKIIFNANPKKNNRDPKKKKITSVEMQYDMLNKINAILKENEKGDVKSSFESLNINSERCFD